MAIFYPAPPRITKPLPRRTLLALAPGLLAGTALAQTATPTPDPRLADRAIGKAEAPVRVIEFFSLTCSHCATFHKETLPQVKTDLVATGRVRMVWRDFPLDRLALVAAAVSRSLPAERYEGFIGALLSNQDRWAFTRGDPKEELAKMAMLAGMNRAKFDEVYADEALQRAILEGRARAEQEFQVQSTPCFVFNGRTQPGNMSFETFARHVQEAKPA